MIESVLSFLNDFSNGYIANYLNVGKEDYFVSDNNTVIIFREQDFSVVEKVKIQRYFEQKIKLYDSYTIERNKILIKIL